MKLSLLAALALLPLASCSNQSSTAAKPADATTAATSTHKGRHHHKSTSTDAAQTAAVKPYPLQTCLVSDEKLDPKDEVISTTYKGQEVKFCCPNCLKKFNKDPEKYMAKLTKA